MEGFSPTAEAASVRSHAYSAVRAGLLTPFISSRRLTIMSLQLSISGVSELRLHHDFLPFLCVIVLEIRQYSCVLCLDKEQKIYVGGQRFLSVRGAVQARLRD